MRRPRRWRASGLATVISAIQPIGDGGRCGGVVSCRGHLPPARTPAGRSSPGAPGVAGTDVATVISAIQPFGKGGRYGGERSCRRGAGRSDHGRCHRLPRCHPAAVGRAAPRRTKRTKPREAWVFPWFCRVSRGFRQTPDFSRGLRFVPDYSPGPSRNRSARFCRIVVAILRCVGALWGGQVRRCAR